MNSLPEGTQLGRYEVLEPVGRGGAGIVYKGRDPVLDRVVALKVLYPGRGEDLAFFDRFRHEAQLVAQLRHPNILQVHDFGEDDGLAYLVTEYIGGGTLEARLHERIGPQQVVTYLRPLTDALSYALERGIIHRDIKPSNILLQEDGSPVLADFGLARVLQKGDTFTPGDRLMGTPDYMAPEIALGKRADHRSDLYSLGVLLYRMTLGRTPFSGASAAAVLVAHTREPVPRPRDLDPSFDERLEAVILKCLAKDPEDRFQSASDLAQEVLWAASGGADEQAQDSAMVPPTASALSLETEVARRDANAPRSPIRVFLVEDHPLLPEAVRRLLERDRSITVVGEAANGEDALVQLEGTACDVVVMDIALPGLNGIEATRQLKVTSPHVNVLILSAFGEASLADAISAGADGYMLKTAAPEELRDAIVDVSMGRSPIHPSLTQTLVKTMAQMAQASGTAP